MEEVRRFDQFGEARKLIPHPLKGGVIHFQQYSSVCLYNQRAFPSKNHGDTSRVHSFHPYFLQMDGIP